MITRAREEQGITIVVSILVMTAMLGLGLAAFAFVDYQTTQTTQERKRESTFNLTEGVLTSQIFTLSQIWPGASGVAYPDCTQSTAASVLRCPNATDISAAYTGPDFLAPPNPVLWNTKVRDNNNPAGPDNIWVDSMAFNPAVASRDANDDGAVWVRAQGSVDGRRRTLVALVRIEEIQENFPRNVITAGQITVSQSGNQIYIDTGDTNVQVRCDVIVQGEDCADYDAGKNQISPGTVEGNYAGGNALSDDALARFKRTAQDNGTYCGPEGTFNTSFCDPPGCPKAAQLNKPGQVVYAAPGGNTLCNYGNSVKPCCGTKPDAPMFLIFENGKLRINTTLLYYGVIYMAFKQGSPCAEDVLDLKGGLTIEGAVAVDGCAGVSAGSTDVNVRYNGDVFNDLTSFGNAGIIRNTFREITGTEAG